jgi:hypothetical protein
MPETLATMNCKLEKIFVVVEIPFLFALVLPRTIVLCVITARGQPPSLRGHVQLGTRSISLPFTRPTNRLRLDSLQMREQLGSWLCGA